MWIAALACGGLEPSPAVNPEREVLADAPADGVAPLGVGAIWSSAGRVWAAPDLAAASDLGDGSRVVASAEGAATIVLGGDGALYDPVTWTEHPLADVLPGPFRALVGAGDSVWFQRDDGVWRLTGGVFLPYHLDGAGITGPFAPGCALGGAPVAWATDAAGTWAIDVGTGAVVTGFAWIADHLGCDATGALYATSDGAARWVVEGEERAVPLRAWAGAVRTHPEARGAWVLTPEGAIHLDGDEPSSLAEGATDGAVDRLGRLLVAGDGVVRWSVGHPIGVLGVPRVLTAEAAFALALTGSEAPAVSATVTACAPDGDCSDAATADGERAAIDVGADGGVLDPARFPAGPLRLDVVATYPSGAARAAVAFVGAPDASAPITWADTIEPLYLDRCDVCHGGATETRLDGKDLWISAIDDVVREIESGAMPLGGPALTSVETALVTQWRDAGFP